ncbi:unnamed protein product [Coregonus sp. 'balchen']|nr:unnamed protein product [Coregonus sp. 'balchen']
MVVLRVMTMNAGRREAGRREASAPSFPERQGGRPQTPAQRPSTIALILLSCLRGGGGEGEEARPGGGGLFLRPLHPLHFKWRRLQHAHPHSTIISVSKGPTSLTPDRLDTAKRRSFHLEGRRRRSCKCL